MAFCQDGQVGPGEYQGGYIRQSDGTLWAYTNALGNVGSGGSGTIGLPIQVVVSPSNLQFAYVAGGLHGLAAIDVNGYVWTTGDNSTCSLGSGTSSTVATNAYKITVDSSGNAFNSVASLAAFFVGNAYQGWLAIKSNGTLWTWGGDTLGMKGNGSLGNACSAPVQILIPGGRLAKQIIGGAYGMVLCTDGTVFTWGNTSWSGAELYYPLGYTGSGTQYTLLHQIANASANITMIAGGNHFNFALAANDTIWTWGVYGNMMGGINSGGDPTGNGGTVPLPVNARDSITGYLDAPVSDIVTSMGSTHIITTNGTLWGFGDQAQGEVGVGPELNYYDSAISTWPGTYGLALIKHPVQVTYKTNWTNIYSGATFQRYVVVKDALDSLYACGRNKGTVVINGINGGDLSGNQGSSYPNGWDVPTIAPVSLWAIGGQGGPWKSMAKYCAFNPTATYCSNYTPPAESPPVANAGGNQSISGTTTTLNGSSSTATYHISYWMWTQVSGPTAAKIQVSGASITSVSNLTTGTYVFKLGITDNEWDSSSATMNVVVNSTTQTNFYFSGAGSGTSCTSGAPCAISYLSSAGITSGDTVSLNRGDVFYTEIIPVSGVYYTAYGTGAMPKVLGMTALSFTNVSGNEYQATYSGVTPQLLVMDGYLKSIAMTPNKSSPAFVFAPASSSTTTVYDAVNAPKAPVGTKLVVYSSAYTRDTCRVTGQTSTILTVAPAVSYVNVGGDGWRILNNFPDSAFEWQDTNSVIRMNLPGGTSGHTFSVPNQGYVIKSTASNFTIDHWDIQGADTALVLLSSGSNISFTNDSLLYGFDGIWSLAYNVKVKNCFIGRITDNGFTSYGNTAIKDSILSSTFLDIGMTVGMGGSSAAGQYMAINTIYNQPSTYAGAGDSTVVKYCSINYVGYMPIYFSGNNSHADSNSVGNYDQNHEDGGGIYMHEHAVVAFPIKSTIAGNYIYKGGSIMSQDGTTTGPLTNGVYLDASRDSVLVSYNTVDTVDNASYYNHGPGNSFLYNTSLGSALEEFESFEFSGGPTITGLKVKHNIFSGNTSGSQVIHLETVNNDITTFGTIDSNYFNHSSNSTAFYKKDNTGGGVSMSFSAWKTTYTGYDQHSSFQQWPFTLIGVPGTASQTIWLPGIYVTPGGLVYGSFVLPSYQSTLGSLQSSGTRIRIKTVSSMGHP
jgi:alpha-tubulin suppressor-like RCC1 family protein